MRDQNWPMNCGGTEICGARLGSVFGQIESLQGSACVPELEKSRRLLREVFNLYDDEDTAGGKEQIGEPALIDVSMHLVADPTAGVEVLHKGINKGVFIAEELRHLRAF